MNELIEAHQDNRVRFERVFCLTELTFLAFGNVWCWYCMYCLSC
jgi:hypothetical protein